MNKPILFVDASLPSPPFLGPRPNWLGSPRGVNEKTDSSDETCLKKDDFIEFEPFVAVNYRPPLILKKRIREESSSPLKDAR